MRESSSTRREEFKMRQFSVDDLTRLRVESEAPCISLYQPTHRYHPDNQQDPIRYRNLRSQLESSLRVKYPARDVRKLVSKYQALEHDHDFWNHRTDGMAILGSPNKFELFELQRPVRELIVVAQNFYTKPLLRILQSADRYQILCLRQNEVTLYEGNRDAIDPVDLSDTLATIESALRESREGPQVNVRVAPGGVAVHYGNNTDERKIDLQRFFRAVDRAILKQHSRPSGLPLILVALTEYHSLFRSISHNPFLLTDGVQIDPGSLNLGRLHALAWQTIEPLYRRRLDTLLSQYELAESRNLACDDVAHVAEATMAGRVGTLLVEADRQLPGRVANAHGHVEHGELQDPEVGDLLNDLAEAVARMKGEVVVVPRDRMPCATGVAAIYRF
jgi:hypothetical protein